MAAASPYFCVRSIKSSLQGAGFSWKQLAAETLADANTLAVSGCTYIGRHFAQDDLQNLTNATILARQAKFQQERRQHLVKCPGWPANCQQKETKTQMKAARFRRNQKGL
eukprot:GHVN01090049.1.p1 GENE.GHVN01090049.1~~GHVN01090049.1.p1  ORF type:complete len:110 (+),score=3.29 GHVN01090049.1:97-426(+)